MYKKYIMGLCFVLLCTEIWKINVVVPAGIIPYIRLCVIVLFMGLISARHVLGTQISTKLELSRIQNFWHPPK